LCVKLSRPKRDPKREKEPELSREKLIHELMSQKVRLHPSLLKEIGEKFRFFPEVKGELFKIYKSFNLPALKTVHACFVKNEIDSKGRFLEYRFAQWLAKHDEKIEELDIDKKFPEIGEIDVVGYDKDKKIIAIAECKARETKAKAEDLDKWITNVKLIIGDQKKKEDKRYLSKAFFVNTKGYTEEALNRFKKRSDVTSSGKLKVSWLERIDIGLYEEREGKIKKVFP